MAIEITDKAAFQISKIIFNDYPDTEDLALIISVKGGGCSGLEF